MSMDYTEICQITLNLTFCYKVRNGTGTLCLFSGPSTRFSCYHYILYRHLSCDRDIYEKPEIKKGLLVQSMEAAILFMTSRQCDVGKQHEIEILRSPDLLT